jgi:hypothetical protein
MPFIALSRSSLVSVLPPTTFLKRPPMALRPLPTSPPDASDFAVGFLASASARMECTSSPRSFSTNLPLVLDPHVDESTSSSAVDRAAGSTSLSLVRFGTE